MAEKKSQKGRYAKRTRTTKRDRRGNGRHAASERDVEIDAETVEKLGVLHCAQDDLAMYFGCDRALITRRFQKQPELREAYEKGQIAGKVSLRRRQMEIAERGNVAMLIWLGKQILGQVEAPQNVINVGAFAQANAGEMWTEEEIKAHLVEMQRAVLEEALRGNGQN
jgi:hypothetical protein